MNYKSLNQRNKTLTPLVHAVSDGRTLCGRSVENSFYTRWEPTQEPVTCQKCNRFMENNKLINHMTEEKAMQQKCPQNFEFYLTGEGEPRYLARLHDNGDLEVATVKGGNPPLTIESMGKGHVKLCPIWSNILSS